MKYNYFTNGLNISSEIPIPELLSSRERPDVWIRIGKVPEHIDNVIATGPLRQISKTEFLLDIANTARYLVKGNSEVIVEPYPNAEENVIRLYLLSTILGVLLHKHDILALHASSIVHNNKAILISGPSGIGKSTVALGFHQKGYEILNDDVSSVFFDHDNRPHVYSGFNHLKLWSNSLEKNGYKTQQFNKLRDNVEKYSFPLAKLKESKPIEIKTVFFISIKDKLEKEILQGIRAYEYIRKNTFRYRLIDGLNKKEKNFAMCGALANSKYVEFIHIVRSEATPHQTLVNYIEEHL